MRKVAKQLARVMATEKNPSILLELGFFTKILS